MAKNEKIVKEEQEHLNTIYAQLLEKEEELDYYIMKKYTAYKKDVKSMKKDVSLNFEGFGNTLDSFIEVEMQNRAIHQMNLTMESAEKQLEKTERLLLNPYFGKVDVNFLEGESQESFYIGVNGFTDKERNQLIYDWRTPIAELFYNNEMGKSSYQANALTVHVTIDRRRQLIVEKSKLLQYFDTAIAIQDDVLLDALKTSDTERMKAITASIQKEQNVIIRDLNHPIILVNGVAGSGKTSAIMQRIAYILYHYRQTLTSDNVWILSPNTGFIEYVSDVLPSLGEKSPLNLTLLNLAEKYLPESFELETAPEYFDRIMSQKEDEQTTLLRSRSLINYIKESGNELLLKQTPRFISLKQNGKIIISKQKIQQLYNTTPKTLSYRERIQATRMKLLAYWEKQLLKSTENKQLQDQVLSLSEEEQKAFFGKLIDDDTPESIRYYTAKRLRSKYRSINQNIEENAWIDLNHLFEQVYHSFSNTGFKYKKEKTTLDRAVILLYIQHCFIEKLPVPKLTFLFIDEVQDYTPAQLELLFTVFSQTHFTMVGDENQAIFNSATPFLEISDIFSQTGKRVKKYDLINSYRSSGAITGLFNQLTSNKQSIEIIPIRPYGTEPTFYGFHSMEECVEMIKQHQMNTNADLTVITKTEKEASQLKIYLDNKVTIVPISLAKGLEFEHVIIYDASTENFQTARDRRILYTAISRATQTLLLTYKDKSVSWLDNSSTNSDLT